MRGPTLGLSRCSVPASRPLLAQREVVGGGQGVDLSRSGSKAVVTTLPRHHAALRAVEVGRGEWWMGWASEKGRRMLSSMEVFGAQGQARRRVNAAWQMRCAESTWTTKTPCAALSRSASPLF